MRIRPIFWTAVNLLLLVTLLSSIAEPVEGALVAYYPFDTDANDLSGNNNNGTVGSSMTFETDTPVVGGKSLKSYAGGGAGNLVTVPTSTSLESINHSLSLAYWMKSGTNPNWARIFQHTNEGAGTQGWMAVRYNNLNETNVRVDTLNPGGQFNQNIARGGPGPFDDAWHHIAFTLDTGLWSKYQDGSLIGQGVYNHGQGLSNTRPLYNVR